MMMANITDIDDVTTFNAKFHYEGMGNPKYTKDQCTYFSATKYTRL
jgi:hypothetical protein